MEFLKIDFPRLPLTIRELADLGGELVGLHLIKSPKLDRLITDYTGPNNPDVERVGWSADTLSRDDIAHYQKIVVALAETIRLMKEIDEVIEEHGGWPGAFVVAADATTTKLDSHAEGVA